MLTYHQGTSATCHVLGRILTSDCSGTEVMHDAGLHVLPLCSNAEALGALKNRPCHLLLQKHRGIHN